MLHDSDGGDDELIQAWTRLGEHYTDRHKWGKAAQYFTQVKHRCSVCACMCVCVARIIAPIAAAGLPPPCRPGTARGWRSACTTWRTSTRWRSSWRCCRTTHHCSRAWENSKQLWPTCCRCRGNRTTLLDVRWLSAISRSCPSDLPGSGLCGRLPLPKHLCRHAAAVDLASAPPLLCLLQVPVGGPVRRGGAGLHPRGPAKARSRLLRAAEPVGPGGGAGAAARLPAGRGPHGKVGPRGGVRGAAAVLGDCGASRRAGPAHNYRAACFLEGVPRLPVDQQLAVPAQVRLHAAGQAAAHGGGAAVQEGRQARRGCQAAGTPPQQSHTCGFAASLHLPPRLDLSLAAALRTNTLPT
jgi:hypothetical protein